VCLFSVLALYGVIAVYSVALVYIMLGISFGIMLLCCVSIIPSAGLLVQFDYI
jgi:hypothetical protein